MPSTYYIRAQGYANVFQVNPCLCMSQEMLAIEGNPTIHVIAPDPDNPNVPHPSVTSAATKAGFDGDLKPLPNGQL